MLPNTITLVSNGLAGGRAVTERKDREMERNLRAFRPYTMGTAFSDVYFLFFFSAFS